jgi:hypothetical protein
LEGVEMRSLFVFLVVFFILLTSLTPEILVAQEPQPAISIDEIIKNRFIRGQVFGIDPSQYEQLKVIVYVYTDKWYIHPYASGGEGKSYAKIREDGSWKIGTVKREFPADQVAALVVNKDYPAPTKTESFELEEIPCIAKIIQDTGYKEGDKDWKL